jgi:hypothetical protein
MITIETDVGVDSLENYFFEIGASYAESLRIPTKVRWRILGIQASLVQFIITWVRRQQASTLVASAEDLHPAAPPPTLIDTTHGLCAALLSDAAIRPDGSKIAEAPQWAGNRYKRLSSIEVRGRQLRLLVVDSHTYAPRVAPFIGLAPDDLALRAARKEDFVADFMVHLKSCLANAGVAPRESADTGRILETIYELFANTEEWATSDLAKTPFTKGVRGILTEVVPITDISLHLASVQSQGTPSIPLREYMTSLVDEGDSITHVLEISVFDSGVGLAQRDLKRPLNDQIPIETEYEAVLNCLRKHGTSSSERTRGMGLFEVMRLMTRLRGFLQLRTGRLGLFRDFKEDKFLLDDSIKTGGAREFYRRFEYLWDWAVDPKIVRRSASVPTAKTKRASVEGALFTFWIPLGTL